MKGEIKWYLQKLKNLWHYFWSYFWSAYFDYPARDLFLIGVTGTDGKTTTSHLIYEIIKKSGAKVCLISTLGVYGLGRLINTGLHVTTPGSHDLQRILALAKTRKIDYVILEVTSHSLDQGRLWGCRFKIGVLTNVSHEHLDYHLNFGNYLNTKIGLLKKSQYAVVNADDKSFEIIKKSLNKNVILVPFSRTKLKKISASLAGSYNLSNIAAALAVTNILGIKKSILEEIIKSFIGVVGRRQKIKNDKGLTIIIDFAHTPNGLFSILTQLKKELKVGNRLICVFGCAAERDELKRPLMGKIATQISDTSIFTAEDPRKENIDKILDEITRGVDKSVNERVITNNSFNQSGHFFVKIPERGEAIWFAVNKLAQSGDIIVICGKGHEKSMNYNGVEYPWSDQEAIELALKGKIKKIEHEK